MKALILAAGMGTRLGGHTKEIPKCLVPVKGKPILQYQLEALLENGIREVVIVIGYQGGKIREFIAAKFPQLSVTFIENKKYAETSSGYSFYLAGKEMKDSPYVHLNCDIIFSAALLKEVIASPYGNVIVLDKKIPLAERHMEQVILDGDGKILKMDSTKYEGSQCKACGIAKFSPEHVQWVTNLQRDFLSRGETKKGHFASIRQALHHLDYYGLDAGDNWLYDINTPEELKKAEEELNCETSAQKAIIFDFDGVILNNEKIRYQTFQQLFKEEFNLALPPFSEIVNEGERSMKQLLDKHNLNANIYDLYKKRNILIERAFSDSKNIIPVKGVVEFLEKAKNQGYKLGIGSNSPRPYLFFLLEKLNLKEMFEAIVTREEIEAKKPAPDTFLLAARRLGAEPENCIVIEDSPNGVKAAKAAGMKSIGIMTTLSRGQLKEADLAVNDFEEVDFRSELFA